MTRKHFQAIAYALHLTRPNNGESFASRYGETESETFRAAHGAWSAAVDKVADACAAANGNFDRGRFLAACNADKYAPAMHGR